MNALVPPIVPASAAVLALGGTIANLACRASRRTGPVALARPAAGFAIVTVGAAVGGAVHLVVVDVVGVAVIAHSLYADAPETRGRRPT